MGITKIRCRWTKKCNRAPDDSCSVPLDELVEEDSILLKKDPCNDYEDCHLADVGCEYAKVGDEIISVPYELYNLPNLMGILSLETWNSCLTEEERFSLAAFLPDMDQEAFWLTMKELLCGENMYFGSPVENLFHGLKGGLYSLKVTQYRECLQLLQRRRYYYSLRSYHHSMLQKFVDMKRTWDNYQPSMTIDERISVWNKKKDHKPILLVDLNAVPADEEDVSKSDRNGETISLLKKPKYTDEGVSTDNPAVVPSGARINLKTKAKGVLKVTQVDTNSVQNYILQPLPSESSRRQPKGLLKIKPKTDHLARHGRENAILIPPRHSFADIQAYWFPPPQFTSKGHEENSGPNLPFPHHTIGNGESHRHSNLPGLMKISMNSQRNVMMVKDMMVHCTPETQEVLPLKNNQNMMIYVHETGGTAECRTDGNSCMNFSDRSKVQCDSSAATYPSSSEYYPGTRQMVPVRPAISEAISSISNNSPEKHQARSSSQLDNGHDQNDAVVMAPHLQMDISEVERENVVYPNASKRENPFSHLNQVESLKKPSMIPDIKPMPDGIESQINRKSKLIKIKVKGWKDYNIRYE